MLHINECYAQTQTGINNMKHNEFVHRSVDSISISSVILLIVVVLFPFLECFYFVVLVVSFL